MTSRKHSISTQFCEETDGRQTDHDFPVWRNDSMRLEDRDSDWEEISGIRFFLSGLSPDEERNVRQAMPIATRLLRSAIALLESDSVEGRKSTLIKEFWLQDDTCTRQQLLTNYRKIVRKLGNGIIIYNNESIDKRLAERNAGGFAWVGLINQRIDFASRLLSHGSYTIADCLIHEVAHLALWLPDKFYHNRISDDELTRFGTRQRLRNADSYSTFACYADQP